MEPGAFTEQIDAAQVVLVAFVLFFFVLLFYLRREDKREGYPLKEHGRRRHAIIGWPAPPPAKTYRLMDGGVAVLPNHRAEPEIVGDSARNGAPLFPAGDPLRAGIGPGAFTLRSETPMRTLDGKPLLMPLRLESEWEVTRGEDDPRGWRVLGKDFVAAGVVSDLWVDRAARILRYLEVRLDGGANVLLPIFHCEIDPREREVRALPLKPEQLALVPRLAEADIITPREEDRVNAFYAGATLYADGDLYAPGL